MTYIMHHIRIPVTFGTEQTSNVQWPSTSCGAGAWATSPYSSGLITSESLTQSSLLSEHGGRQLPQEAGMKKISSSQLATQHLSPCNSSVKKKKRRGRDCRKGLFLYGRDGRQSLLPPLLSSWIWILFQGWRFLCCVCGENTLRIQFVTGGSQRDFQVILRKDVLLPPIYHNCKTLDKLPFRQITVVCFQILICTPPKYTNIPPVTPPCPF